MNPMNPTIGAYERQKSYQIGPTEVTVKAEIWWSRSWPGWHLDVVALWDGLETKAKLMGVIHDQYFPPTEEGLVEAKHRAEEWVGADGLWEMGE